MNDTQMKQAEFYSIVAAYPAPYTGYDKQEAKKEAEAIWTRLKDDYIMGLFCFVLCKYF